MATVPVIAFDGTRERVKERYRAVGLNGMVFVVMPTNDREEETSEWSMKQHE